MKLRIVFLSLLALFLCLFLISCAGPEKETNVGNQEMRVSGHTSQPGDPTYYTQAFVIIAPGATTDITSSNKQESQQDLDGNLGYNGQASSGQGNLSGAWKFITETLQGAGLLPNDSDDSKKAKTDEEEKGSNGDNDQTSTGAPIVSTCFDHFDDGTSGYSGTMIFMQAYSDTVPFDSCFLDDKEMTKNPGLDNGRPFWKLKGHYDKAEITCQRGDKLYLFKVKDGDDGKC